MMVAVSWFANKVKKMVKKNTCVLSLFMLNTLWLNFAHAGQVLFTSWNLEWLTNNPVEKIAASKRTNNDFFKLALHLNSIRPDILAFQEVDSISTINKILDNKYNIFISDRNNNTNSYLQFSDINQYTGFAVSERWQVTDPQDIRLSPGRKLKFATYIVLQQDSAPAIHLLSVHLKAGCGGKYKRNDSCNVLRKQGKKLNQWIKTRLNHNESFILLGDFNHNLAYPRDWLWEELTKGTKENHVRLATQSSEANCRVRSKRSKQKIYRYRNLIDHIVVSGDLNFSQPVQNLYPEGQVLNYQLSDHCPLSMKLDL